MKLSFNIKKTKAIIIATTNYTSLPEVKPAKGNMESIVKILSNAQIIGLKKEQIITLFNKTSTEIIERLEEEIGPKNMEVETLIVYYIGHGYRLERGKNKTLYLTGTNSKTHLIERRGVSGIAFDTLKEILEEASWIQQRIIILDACYSGLSTLSDASDMLTEEESMIAGTYILASSAGYEKSYFNTESQHTHFTDALVHVLENGITNEQEYLDLNDVFLGIQERLRAVKKAKDLEELPEPRQKNNLRLQKNQKHFYFAKNRKFDKIEVTRKVIHSLIAEGEAFVLQLEFEKAHKKYAAAVRKSRPKSKYLGELDRIDVLMDKCDEKWEMFKTLKIKYENLYEAELIKAQSEIVNKNAELQNLKASHKEITAKNKTQIQDLRTDINAKKKEITDLKATLKQLTINHKAEQKAKQKAEATMASLQKSITQKAEQISDLEKQLIEKQTFLQQMQSVITKQNKTIAQKDAEIKDLKEQFQQKPTLVQKATPTAFVKKSNQKDNFIETIGNVSFDMVFVEGGSFKIGSEVADYERTFDKVILKDYYIGKYPVTQKLWQAVLGNNPSHFKGDNLPVEKVSWNDAQKFIQALNIKTGKNYHLPSEAQWEFAARGGNQSKNYKFAGSDNLEKVGWYRDNSNNKTHPVGEKQPNELGIYDMSGNVWEWCEDKWHKNYDGAPNDGSAREDGNSSHRVVRGGGWFSIAQYCRVSNRSSGNAGNDDYYRGFRLALSSK